MGRYLVPVGGIDDSRPGLGVGVDVEQIRRFAARPRGIFTSAEESYCSARANPAESFAGTWAAKEAVVKALAGWSAISMREVEIVRDISGAPQVRLRLTDQRVPSAAAHPEVQISISHAGELAVAIAIATWQRPATEPA